MDDTPSHGARGLLCNWTCVCGGVSEDVFVLAGVIVEGCEQRCVRTV